MPLLPQLNQQSRNSAGIVINAGVFTPKLGWKFANYNINLGWQITNYILKLGWKPSNYTIQYNSMIPIFLRIVAGNFGFNWGFNLQDAANAIVNLSAATSLKFKAQLESDPTVNFSNSMVVDSAVAGTCHYTVQTTDFQVPGVYNGQISVFAGSTEIFSFNQITIQVDPSVL